MMVLVTHIGQYLSRTSPQFSAKIQNHSTMTPLPRDSRLGSCVHSHTDHKMNSARAFDYPLFFPRDEADVPPRILQLPIIRVPGQGRIGVPIFAFLTGFVCALKPLKLSQQRSQHGEALAAVARSAFRRPIRLALPATIATAISFVCTALGGYRAAASSDSIWVRFDAPIQEVSLPSSLWFSLSYSVRLFFFSVRRGQVLFF